MQALSLLLMTWTVVLCSDNGLLQFAHFASGWDGLQPKSIRYPSCRSQQKLSGLPPVTDASVGA
jgi:hypothetical protein